MPALAEELLHGVLDRMPVARLALRDHDDQPEALPVVIARAAGALWFPIDGKPKRSGAGLSRLARLERAPRVMLLFDHYGEDWSALWWLRLSCMAEIVRDGHADWAAAVAALTLKYPQYATVPMFKDEAIMVRLEWSKIGWWQAAPDGIARWLDAHA